MAKSEWTWQDKARCPFFSSESAGHHKIVCNEGPTVNTSISVTFTGKDYLRQNYMRQYCCKEFEQCEVYKLCEKKWNT